MQYVLSIDQGTTGTRAMIFDKKGVQIANAHEEHEQIYPKPGWVEHSADEIWEKTLTVIQNGLEVIKSDFSSIDSIGVTNQRETVVFWDKKTGKPVHNAIVWQCRRTADICYELKDAGHTELFKEKTGLVLDPYFSGTKIRWLIENVPKIKDKIKNNELLVGTIDSWLIWKLTGNHITDYSNASRTLLFNIKEGKWDEELLDILKIPIEILPEVRQSSDKDTYGETGSLFGRSVPVCGNAGDQQAALFGQNCFNEGEVKNTYGTGNFLLMNTGEKIVYSKQGLLSTIAWKIDGKLTYALEGSVFVSGAVIKWLEEGLQIVKEKAELVEAMNKTEDNQGVYFVPAFVGLGTPHWDAYARGTIIGLTRGTKREHIIRAALESICYQSHDVIQAMEKDSNIKLSLLRADGGVTNCEPVLQFQADISGVTVQRPVVNETTALGAAYLAGLASGFWDNLEDIKNNFQIGVECAPKMSADKKREYLTHWHEAVKRSKGWVR